MKKRNLIMVTIFLLLLSINPAFSQERPVMIATVGLIDGSSIADAYITDKTISVITVSGEKTLALETIREIRFSPRHEGITYIRFVNDTSLTQVEYLPPHLNIVSEQLGRMEIPQDNIDYIILRESSKLKGR